MSNTTTTEAHVKTVSTEELRYLLDNQRRIEFWNVLTDQ
jgi:hypothetical protein